VHESFCENYYECYNNVWVLHECEYKQKFDSDHFCKTRNFVQRACETKYPNACSDGDLKKDLHKCPQFYKCVLGDWVKNHCGTSYYDEELGHCNSKAAVLLKRPECATCDETIDSDAFEAEDATHDAGTVSNAEKYPELSVFKTFSESQKDHVRFVQHKLVASDCSSAWEPSPHPFECHKYLNCQGADIGVAACPTGFTWKKNTDYYGKPIWGGYCEVGAPCVGYCGDPTNKHIPFSFMEEATRIPPCSEACTCVTDDAIVSTFDADDYDGDQFTYCVNHIEYRVYCCEGTVLNPVTRRCDDPAPA
jgi:hypothetical protein